MAFNRSNTNKATSIIDAKSKEKQKQKKYEICKAECVKLRDQIDSLKESENKDILKEECIKSAQLQHKLAKYSINALSFGMIGKFEGHTDKIYDIDWSSDSSLILSASHGRLLIWDSKTKQTKLTYQLPSISTWIKACAFSNSGLIACGGLDNICSVYKLRLNDDNTIIENDDHKQQHSNGHRASYIHHKQHNNGHRYNQNRDKTLIKQPPYKQLQHHEGYLSSVEFLTNDKVLTASGDSTCILWDIRRGAPECVYLDHSGDVTTMQINKDNRNVFLSGSADATIKVWDMRLSKCVGEFAGHDADVTDVDWFPDNFAFASGSEDSTLKLWDLRSYKQLNEYGDDDLVLTVTRISFSKSGNLLFAGYDDDPFTVVWNVANTNRISDLQHHEKVTSLQVAPDGSGLLTASWDKSLRLWVPIKK